MRNLLTPEQQAAKIAQKRALNEAADKAEIIVMEMRAAMEAVGKKYGMKVDQSGSWKYDVDGSIKIAFQAIKSMEDEHPAFKDISSDMIAKGKRTVGVKQFMGKEITVQGRKAVVVGIQGRDKIAFRYVGYEYKTGHFHTKPYFEMLDSLK